MEKEMKLKQCSEIRSLMVLGSSVCNLNCSYCYLSDQHRTNAYVLLNKEIQKAWKDGTYVKNIKEVFKEIGTPLTVTDLEIWGGEPLIMIENMLTPIKEIMEYFPNLNYVNIPTNLTRVNHVSDFVWAIEETKRKINFNDKINVHLQMSLDAPDGEAQQFGHPVKWDVYRKNIETICQEMSQKPKCEKVMLGIEWHATMTTETILKYFSTYDDIKHYFDEFNKLHLFINETIKKYDLQSYMFQESCSAFPHNATPAEISVEDALNLTNILYFSRYIEKHIPYRLERNSLSHIYKKNAADGGMQSTLMANQVCLESGVSAITIMYDGSLCECPCDYILNFDGYWDWIKDNPLKRKEYREGLYKKQFYLNLLTASQKEKDDFDWYTFEGSRLNLSTSMNLMMNFYIEMAMSGQIDYQYYQNLEKLFKDLTQFNQSYSCPKDQLMYTFSPHLGGTGAARKYFNGIARMCQNDIKEDLEFEAKGAYKWNLPKKI